MKAMEDLKTLGVSVILPMHNEEKIVKFAIQSLLNQTFKYIDIICVLDNCTDNTENILLNDFEDNIQVKIFKTINNTGKKAGALNQLLDYHFDDLKNKVLIMDADTILAKDAVAKGIKFLNNNKDHAAVCSMAGVLNVKSKNILWYLQNIEYGFGDSGFIETQGNVFVCRGMYSMYCKSSLENVLNRGYIYDLNSITEDYELTLELKRLNYKISSSTEIKAYTEVPITLKELWIQRVRWIKGGVEDLIKHGLKRHTLYDIWTSVFYRFLILIQLVFMVELLFVKHINISWLIVLSFILTINSLFRLKYIRHKSKITYIILFTMIPMLFYGFLDAILTIYATYLAIFKIKIKWR